MNAALVPPSAPSLAPAAPPQAMPALVQRGYGDAVFHTAVLPVPTPGPGEVLVQVHGAGIDRGTWHIMTGRPAMARLALGLRTPKQAVPGLDVSGVVVAVGAGVTRVGVGDAVFGIAMGSFAAFALCKQEKLARAPRAIPLVDAGALAVSGTTALQAVVDVAAVEAGHRVLITGASGGVGTFAVQIAKARGAHVTAVCSAKNADLVQRLGADVVVDYAAVDVFAAAGPAFDAIVDIAGNPSLSRLRRRLAPSGRVAFVGGEHGGATFGMERPLVGALLSLFVKQRFLMVMPKEHFAPMEALAALVDAGHVRPVVERRVGLDGVADVVRAMPTRAPRGKIVVEPAPAP